MIDINHLLNFKKANNFNMILTSGRSSVVERLVANEVVFGLCPAVSLTFFNHTLIWSQYGTQLVAKNRKDNQWRT